MALEKKTIRRLEWRGIEEREYAFSPFEMKDMNLSGEAGLMYMKREEKPFQVKSFGKPVLITGSGYSWLHIAPYGENFWATVMFDGSGKLFQYYFDIVLENHVLPRGDAWFTDLFLDVVMERGGRYETLDREELDRALEGSVISESAYALALSAHERLLNMIDGSEPQLRNECERIRTQLMKTRNPIF